MAIQFTNYINQYYESSGDLDGSTTPILFIHGLGSSSKDWEFQWSEFAEHYPLIAPDLRGHGKSDKPNVPYSVPMFSNDIVALLKSLTQKPVHVVGFSLGGMIAFQLVVDHPQLVKTLTIVNSAPAVSFLSAKLCLAFQSRKFTVKWFGMKPISNSIALSQFPKPEQADLRRIFIERFNENDPTAYQNALAAFQHWDLKSRLNQIQCPTLIMGSDQDYTPLSKKAEYLSLIPHGELVVIHDSHHLSPMDQPEQFNQTLKRFLREN